MGTAKDHVAPWRSVYKVHLLTDTDVTFLLTSGGHNAGIVSEPGHPGRSLQVSTKDDTDRFMDPDTWATQTSKRDGSWWPEWIGWLNKRSGKPIKPRAMGASDKGLGPLCDAPGTYVHQD